MESNEPIVILNITDTNTTGLTGLDEPNLADKDKKHHKLHKTNAENISVDGGGSWGLGKIHTLIFLPSECLLHPQISPTLKKQVLHLIIL